MDKLLQLLYKEHLFRSIIELETSLTYMFEITNHDEHDLCSLLQKLRDIHCQLEDV